MFDVRIKFREWLIVSSDTDQETYLRLLKLTDAIDTLNQARLMLHLLLMY